VKQDISGMSFRNKKLPMLNGVGFYKKIHSLNKALQEIGLDDRSRWVFNHGIPTSMMFLCKRIDLEILELTKIYKEMVKENPGRQILELSNRESGPKNENERRGYELYRWLQLDLFLFFSSLRSILDELCSFVLKPHLKVDNRELKDSFDDLFSGLERSRKDIHIKHQDFFDNIEQDHSNFRAEIRAPRDKVIHFSAQIELKHENNRWYYTIVSEGDILKRPQGRIWEEFDKLNYILNLAATIFEKSVNYILENFTSHNSL